MKLSILISLLPIVLASPFEKRQSAASATLGASASRSTSASRSGSSGSSSPTSTAVAAASSSSFRRGASTSNIFPPPGVSNGPTADFPNESQVGFPGPTPTGIEPREISVTSAYPYKTAAFPLIIPSPAASSQNAESSEEYQSGQFNALRYFGNLSPWYSNTDGWGLPNASPSIPESCELTQVFLLYRHGARYPTSGAPPSAFAAKLGNTTNFNGTGPAAFLNTWQLGIGAELLTPFGRLQNFELGIGFRNLYGVLLNNFTAAGVLPVFTTESQDRMVKTAQNFAAGFFGIPAEGQYNLVIEPETPGINNTGAPYEVCTNSNNARGTIGSSASTNFTNVAYQSTVTRLQPYLTGFNLTTTDINAMLQLCSYETVAYGFSRFCDLFTEEDFRNYEYAYSLSFYYNNFLGSPVSAAQGLGYLDKYIERLSGQRMSYSNSAENFTYDNPTQSPLNQSIYADATHEVVVADTLAALNLTALAASGPLPLDRRPDNYTFEASKIVPFATHLVTQIMECSSSQPTTQMRFILNDAVVPLNYEGCDPNDFNGLCSKAAVLAALQQRASEINFAQACLTNYTVPIPPTNGQDLNGLPPRAAGSAAVSSAAAGSTSLARSSSASAASLSLLPRPSVTSASA